MLVYISSISFFRKEIVSSKLNIPRMPSYGFSFNPMQYSTVGKSNLKEGSYDRNDFSRNSYLHKILDNLNGSDIRTLVKYIEEKSQLRKFSIAFPTQKSHEYFQFMDYLSYNDKLLDAFEERFGDNLEDGIAYVENYCKHNAHI